MRRVHILVEHDVRLQRRPCEEIQKDENPTDMRWCAHLHGKTTQFREYIYYAVRFISI